MNTFKVGNKVWYGAGVHDILAETQTNFYLLDGVSYWVHADGLTLYKEEEKEMNLKDKLKTGMFVKFKDGEWAYVLKDVYHVDDYKDMLFIAKTCEYIELKGYDNKLSIENRYHGRYDVIKIIRPHYGNAIQRQHILVIDIEAEKHDVIWESPSIRVRKIEEEIEEYKDKIIELRNKIVEIELEG